MTVAFRAPAPGDISRISRRMREIDVRECAAVGLSPSQALRMGAKASLILWTGTVDGHAEAMFGVRPVSLLDGIGAPWLLGTDLARRSVRHWLTVAPIFVAAMQETFPRLENQVHRDNTSAIRWLEHLGFVVEPELVHIGQEPMRRFHRGLPIHVPSAPRRSRPDLRVVGDTGRDGGPDHRGDGRVAAGRVPAG